MSKYAPIGAIKGTEIIIAEKISIMHPIASKKIFNISKNTNFDEIFDLTHSKIEVEFEHPLRKLREAHSNSEYNQNTAN